MIKTSNSSNKCCKYAKFPKLFSSHISHVKHRFSDIFKIFKDENGSFKGSFSDVLRDRIAEAYFGAVGAFYEPQYSLGREICCKVVKVVSTFDDIYDAYGTKEELEIMTQAVQRWDSSCVDELPDYMKVCYQTLLDTYRGFEQSLADKGRSSHVYYLREKALKIIGSQPRCYRCMGWYDLC